MYPQLLFQPSTMTIKNHEPLRLSKLCGSVIHVKKNKFNVHNYFCTLLLIYCLYLLYNSVINNFYKIVFCCIVLLLISTIYIHYLQSLIKKRSHPRNSHCPWQQLKEQQHPVQEHVFWTQPVNYKVFYFYGNMECHYTKQHIYSLDCCNQSEAWLLYSLYCSIQKRKLSWSETVLFWGYLQLQSWNKWYFWCCWSKWSQF